MFKIQFCQFPELGAVAIGAKIHGAELMSRPHHAGSHVNDTQKMTLALSTKAIFLESVP
jgi:hypothetical protein